jgi:hypothetical protein
MNRTTLWIGLALASLGATLAAPSTRTFSLEKPFAANLPLRANGRETVYLHLAPGAQQLEVRVRGHTQRVDALVPNPDEIPHGGEVLTGDWNFDGYTDIAVPTDSGYGGVNYFYDLYTFVPSKSRFVPLEFPGGDQLCNPELRAQTRTIETDCKSGPKYESQDFRFIKGRPYTYRSAEMVILNDFDSDQYLVYAVSTFNPTGKLVRSSISDDPHREEAPLRYVPVPRADLYDAPREDARTDRYIVRGDAVRILEVLETDSGQWLKIAYRSRKLGRILKWVSFAH